MVRFRNLRGGQQEEEAPPSDEIEDAEDPEEDTQQAEEQEGDPDTAEEDDPDMAEEDDEVEVEMGDEDDEDDEDTIASLEAEAEGLEPGKDDAALKELAARMSVLQSNLESVQGTRGEIEDKLSKMEERMMRLGSLAEAVSSKYNPFIAENSPEEPSWGQDGPASVEEEAAEPGPGAEAPAQGARPEPEPEPTPEPSGAPDPSRPEAQDLEAMAGLLGGQGAEEPEQAPDATTAAEALSQDRPQIGERLEEKFMMLEWVDLMLRRVGRANLLDLLEYYEGLGWLDQEAKRRVIRVAVGMDAPDRPEEKERGEWRGDLDLHERSLITIERLHGNDISAADIESLRMDMQRFFGE